MRQVALLDTGNEACGDLNVTEYAICVKSTSSTLSTVASAEHLLRHAHCVTQIE